MFALIKYQPMWQIISFLVVSIARILTYRDLNMCTKRFLQQGASATAAARTLRVNQALVSRMKVSSPNPLEFSE